MVWRKAGSLARVFIAGVLLLTLNAVHASAADLLAQAASPGSPCEDAQFLSLQKKPLDEMSSREYEYFRQKEKECDEYRKLSLSKATVSSDPVADARRSGTNNGVILGIVGTCAFLLLISAIAASGS